MQACHGISCCRTPQIQIVNKRAISYKDVLKMYIDSLLATTPTQSLNSTAAVVTFMQTQSPRHLPHFFRSAHLRISYSTCSRKDTTSCMPPSLVCYPLHPNVSWAIRCLSVECRWCVVRTRMALSLPCVCLFPNKNVLLTAWCQPKTCTSC